MPDKPKIKLSVGQSFVGTLLFDSPITGYRKPKKRYDE